MNLKEIREILELLKGSDVTEFELGRGDTTLKVRRGAPPMLYAPQLQPAAAPAGFRSPDAAEAKPSEAPAAKPAYKELVSPIVGTFYRSPAPDASPFVEVGARVVKGQVLCIIEAMKIMNPIDAEVAGVIKEVCVQDAQPVEFGQVLFRVDTNG